MLQIIKKKVDFENHIGGESPVEQHQRNSLSERVDSNANDNDLIILSDSDEIPDLTKLNQIKKYKIYCIFSNDVYV